MRVKVGNGQNGHANANVHANGHENGHTNGSKAIRRTAQRGGAALKTESLDYHEVRNVAETRGQVPAWFITRSMIG